MIAVTSQGFISHSFTTTDQGASWLKATNTFPGPFYKTQYQSSSALPDGTVFFFSDGAVFRTTDHGDKWVAFAGPKKTLSGQMLSADSGMIIRTDSDKDGTYVDLRFSTDSGQFFTESLAIGRIPQGYTATTAQQIGWDTILLVANSSNEGSLFVRSTDAGKNWSYDTILPGWPSLVRYAAIYYYPESKRVYLLSGIEGVPEYLVSDDYGASWQPSEGNAPARVYRYLETGESDRWKLVGRVPLTNFRDLWALKEHLADSVFYSSNGGVTWHLQEEFVGDSIVDLSVSATGEVYVMSFSNNTVYASRWDARASVTRADRFRIRNLLVHPNPSAEYVQFLLPFSGIASVTLVDILGNIVHREERAVSANVLQRLGYPRSLSSMGTHYLIVESDGNRASQLIMRSR